MDDANSETPRLKFWTKNSDVISESELGTILDDKTLGIEEKCLICFALTMIYKCHVPKGRSESFRAALDQTPFGITLLEKLGLDRGFSDKGLYRFHDALLKADLNRTEYRTLYRLIDFERFKSRITLPNVERAISFLPFEVAVGFNGDMQCLTLDLSEGFETDYTSGSVEFSKKSLQTLSEIGRAHV